MRLHFCCLVFYQKHASENTNGEEKQRDADRSESLESSGVTLAAEHWSEVPRGNLEVEWPSNTWFYEACHWVSSLRFLKDSNPLISTFQMGPCLHSYTTHHYLNWSVWVPVSWNQKSMIYPAAPASGLSASRKILKDSYIRSRLLLSGDWGMLWSLRGKTSELLKIL